MHFEVTHSKMNEGKGYMGETRARVERSYKMLNEVYNSGMFNGGSFGGVGNSMGVLLQRLAVERNECAMLENGLASISNIYLNLDSTLAGNGLMNNVTPDTQLDPDMVESITSVYSGSGDVPGKNGGRHGGGGRRIDSFSRGRQGRGGGSGGGGHLRGRDSDIPEFRTDYPEFTTGYIVVDDMSFIPLSQDLYDRVYNEENGLYYLHNSEKPEGFWNGLGTISYGILTGTIGGVADAMDLTAGDFMTHFYFGGGEDYYYDAAPLLQNPTVNSYFNENINSVAMSCVGNIEDGETVIIANSRDNPFTGCHSFLDGNGVMQYIEPVANANTFASINSAQAGVVCEVTRDGDQYTMTYNYYIIDYYDYDPAVLEVMYNMNTYGYAENFMGYGKISGVATWTAGSDTVENYPAVMIGNPGDPSNPISPFDFSPIESIPYPSFLSPN